MKKEHLLTYQLKRRSYLRHYDGSTAQKAAEALPEVVSGNPYACYADKLYFIGLDLAPHDQLESGVVLLNRQRQLLRAEKREKDADLLQVIASMGPAAQSLVMIDTPQPFTLSNKWQLEELKWHPNRLLRLRGHVSAEATPTRLHHPTGRWGRRDKPTAQANRCEALAMALIEQGAHVVLYHGNVVRLRYGCNIPFKLRSNAGGRLFHTWQQHYLGLHGLPAHPPASVVLEATLGAFLAWRVFDAGQCKPALAAASNFSAPFTLQPQASGLIHYEPLF